MMQKTTIARRKRSYARATDFRYESRTSTLSCFASTNSWFVDGNDQKHEVCKSDVLLDNKILISTSYLAASQNCTRQTDGDGSWFSQRFCIRIRGKKKKFYWLMLTGTMLNPIRSVLFNCFVFSKTLFVQWRRTQCISFSGIALFQLYPFFFLSHISTCSLFHEAANWEVFCSTNEHLLRNAC